MTVQQSPRYGFLGLNWKSLRFSRRFFVCLCFEGMQGARSPVLLPTLREAYLQPDLLLATQEDGAFFSVPSLLLWLPVLYQDLQFGE